MAAEEEDRDATGIVYKIKVVQFLGRSVPIILQNDNGPCPLLAICNVLLLRSNVTLNIDKLEVSQQELMSLVAEWLLDANSNILNKDDEFVRNQQQNIGDAIQLLPRLATGIDVNVRFRHIHDFEFTPECAIFDLCHVGLVHGWLCDPQDEQTFKVIGSNSYNTLVEKLVARHASTAGQLFVQEESSVDFSTVTALGIPRPLVLQTSSNSEFETMNHCNSKTRKKGEEEEAVEFLQALQLSQTSTKGARSLADTGSLRCVLNHKSLLASRHELSHLKFPSVHDVGVDLTLENEDIPTWPGDEIVLPEDTGIRGVVFTPIVHLRHNGVDATVPPQEVLQKDVVMTLESTEDVIKGALVDNLAPTLGLCLKPVGEDSFGREVVGMVPGESSSSSSVPFPVIVTDSFVERVGNDANAFTFTGGKDVQIVVDPLELDSQDTDCQNVSTSEGPGFGIEDVPSRQDKQLSPHAGSGLLSEDVKGGGCMKVYDDELLNEGECSLPDSRENISGFQAQVPGNQCVRHDSDRAGEDSLSVAITEGFIIENFLSSTASQLTYYGLFSLLDGLRNNELYVFFRNNHFSTLFKYDGQIYLLATDQGYLSQPDLVWEKLTQVDGDTVFATGSFTQFQVASNNGIWNERDAVVATADFMSLQQPSMDGATYTSDLQLAFALQQQELAQQQQQQLRIPSSGTKASAVHGGHLVAGSVRSSVPPPRQDKPKEKCTIM